jgi:hypothetical protein
METAVEKLVTFGVTRVLDEAETECLYARCMDEDLPKYHEFVVPRMQCLVILRGHEIVLIKVLVFSCSLIVMKDHPGQYSGPPEYENVLYGALAKCLAVHHLHMLQCQIFN